MNSGEKLGYLLATTAFVLKIFRIPYHTWFILLAIFFLLGIYIYQLVKGAINKDSFFIGISTTFFLGWLLFLTKFFPLPIIPLSLAIISLLIGIFFKFQNKSSLADARQWVNLVVIIICIAIFKMPKDQRYYLTGIRFNYTIENDYQTWAKYSWFLYLSDKYEEAYLANEKALHIANEHKDEYWIEKIIDQQEKIKDRNWVTF